MKMAVTQLFGPIVGENKMRYRRRSFRRRPVRAFGRRRSFRRRGGRRAMTIGYRF